ncbi:MAG TPA: fumarylacetoacetate hydrolase family protein [Acidimicrobiia bacterium]|nr:fumarylacetoacetate hydrolase family protein [Acidimicrobiia bacterium]
MTAPDWENRAVRKGMERLLAQRSDILESGGRTMGWKLGFGAPAWLEKFDLSGPLLGFLPESRSHPPGATISCEGWVRAVAEPEIAVHIGRDVEDPARAADAVSGLGAAIELADVDPPPEDLEETLAGNIFHRAVILGEPDPGMSLHDVGRLRARVQVDGAEVADTTDLETLTGNLVDILGHAAALLAAAGERLRAGEVVIAGSVVPPIEVSPGSEVSYELSPLAPVTVRV